MDFTMAGSFRQRARNAERTTKQSREHRRQRVAVHTHEAIQDFEEHLRTIQDSGVIDDLPMSAEAGHLHSSSAHLRGTGTGPRDKANTIPRDNSSDASSTANRTSFKCSQGDLHRSASASAGLDIDQRYTMRPPSPLSMYDYGAISTRPRSVLAQRSKAPGEAMRPSSRQAGGPGFYFPGPEFRQGSYGFSMMEPIHMLPRVWTETKQPPHRWPRDPSDVRPATTECNEHRHRRSRTAGPLISDMVRSNTTHDLRAAHAFRSLDKKTEETQLEEVRFQQGMFDGRFRDPMLDAGVSGPALVASSAAHCHFLAEDHSDAPEAQQVASRLLFGIEEALTQSKGHLRSLFRSVNHGTVGVLEPHELLEGLERLGIIEREHLTPEGIIQAMAVIDPNFDGRINFSALERAVAAARGVQRSRAQEAERAVRQHEHKQVNTYHPKLPIDVVRIERMPKSLFDFERAFERFRKQQKELLAHHGEAKL